EATGAEHDAEAQARHPEPGCGRGDPPIAGGHQVGARSQRAAVAQRERRQRRMMQRLQELLDAHEPMQEIAVRLLIQVGKVEPRTEMPPSPRNVSSRAPLFAARATATSSASTSPASSALALSGRLRTSSITAPAWWIRNGSATERLMIGRVCSAVAPARLAGRRATPLFPLH